MKEAFGKPGFPPNWPPASKQGVGTSYNDESKVWFTIANGVITEVFYPTVDAVNTRDIQFLVTDGETFFDEERKDTDSSIEYIDPKALAYRITNTAKNRKYRIVKEVLTDPRGQSLVMKVSFEPLRGKIKDYNLYILFVPHIKNMGYENSGRVLSYRSHVFLTAWRENIAAALTADIPFRKMSAGYSGYSDGWQDLKSDLKMDWLFESAENGNIALTAELDLSGRSEFTVCLSFGSNETAAVMEAVSTMNRGYDLIEKEYISGWKGYLKGLKDLSGSSLDKGRLYWISTMVLRAHQDKTHRGVTASLSVPWGEARGDGEAGGYHLIWPRDLVKAAFAFMAIEDKEAPVRILKFLADTQRPDGSWPQNMWLDGRRYWHGVQLDEVAFPVMLAWRLKRAGMLKDDYYLMVKKAASFVVKEGPVTEQDRWEENSGFSPSTLAAEISALVCAAHWAAEAGELKESRYLFEIADYWAASIEEWTFSQCDCLSKEDPGHFLRIVSKPREALSRTEELCHVEVFIKNLPPNVMHHQGQIIDAGFLELARYGVRPPDSPHIKKTLRLVDAMLKRDMPYGPLFYRYNNDGYGEKEDGSPFDGSGIGRLWPLLSGERGMYETLAGNNADLYIKAMEGSANEGGILPEQVWDSDDIPQKGLFKGKATGAASPLMWAHAEYIKLLRTKADHEGCDVIPEVYKRYVDLKTTLNLRAWKKNKPIRFASNASSLRIVSPEPAVIVWTGDGWGTKEERLLQDTGLGLYYADFEPGAFKAQSKLLFTFRYEDGRWEGADFEIDIL